MGAGPDLICTAPDALAIAEAFDLRALPISFYDDPFPTYRALRTHAPVKQMPDGSLFLTRYADCARVYADPATFSSDKKREFAPKYGETSALYAHHTTSLVFNDAPYHMRVRRILQGAFTPRVIAQLEPALTQLVDHLLDRAEAARTIDAIGDFAAAIPIEVIGNLLDIPKDERGPLRDWSLAILGALEPNPDEAQCGRGDRAVREFIAFLTELTAARRRRPGAAETDLLTRLIAGDDEGALAHDELLHNCIFILNAGHETTTNLIGNGLWLLDRDCDARRQLSENPALWSTAIEEILRYESSNQLGNRMTRLDAQFDGVRAPAGTPITLCLGAANRDPSQFPDAERFDIARTPNRHLAFGGGVHKCLGLSLARLEGRVALERFVTRYPRFEAAGAAQRNRRARFRGFASLPLDVRPA